MSGKLKRFNLIVDEVLEEGTYFGDKAILRAIFIRRQRRRLSRLQAHDSLIDAEGEVDEEYVDQYLLQSIISVSPYLCLWLWLCLRLSLAPSRPLSLSLSLLH